MSPPSPLAGRIRALPALVWWLLPPLICLGVFYRGLLCWFQQDDFVWLRLEIHSLSDFWRLLVEPQAQGTIRPLSERFFFIGFRRLFDLNAFPYRVFVFLTQFANLLLLTALARRMTGSRLAGAVACLVWGLNIALVVPMGWTSAYNQVLCSFFYLSGFLLFLRHVETGRWSFYFAQWGTFLFGFGALEAIVAYPVVLTAYCFLAARPHLTKTLPLWFPSAAYAGLHLWVIPRAATGPYTLHLDGKTLLNAWDYWSWALGPPRLAEIVSIGRLAALVLVLLLTAALLAAIARAPGDKRRLAVFGLAWFFLTLAPVLPLRDHRLDYYLAIPAIGLALAAAAVIHSAPRFAAAGWLLIYFVCSVPFISWSLSVLYGRSQSARRLIEGVRQARALHPDKTILLTGVSDTLFYSVIYDEGPRAAGLRNIFLAPTNEGITPAPGLSPPSDYQLPAAATLAALQKGSAVVYAVSPEGLQNITTRYTGLAPLLLRPVSPRRVNVAEPLMADLLGPGWYEIQGNHRWMGSRAELTLGAPRSPGERLRVTAFHSEHPNAGPVTLTVSVNGAAVGRAEIRDNRSGDHVFPLPASVVGLENMTVSLETSRTFHAPGDPRDLGLAFGIVELLGPR